VSNARHATGAPVGVELDCRPGEVQVKVSDDGPEFEPRSAAMPSSGAERRWGLPIVARLAEVVIDLRGDRTEVTAVLPSAARSSHGSPRIVTLASPGPSAG
jgi:signal transduction histidine kinase